MKFKNLLKNINTLAEEAGEHTFGGGLFVGDPQQPGGSTILTDKGTFNLDLPRHIDAVNAMLYSFTNRDFIDPTTVLGVVKNKLNVVGLDFLMPKQTLSDGLSTFDLVQYGSPQLGVYGQNPYEDINEKGFKQGDGIKEKLGHSLALTVTVTKQPNHLRRVQMVIVPTETSAVNADSRSNDCGCQH